MSVTSTTLRRFAFLGALLPESGAAARLRSARLVRPDVGATSDESIVEQLVRNIKRASALRGRDLLDQCGQPRGEVGRKLL